MHRFLTITFLIFVTALPAQADPVHLTAGEIQTLLTGNTIRGTWNGDAYKQYFMMDGGTIYAPRRSQSTRGEWRVNPEKNLYESFWERSGWSSYGIVRENGTLFWVTPSGKNPQPFKVLPGEQLVWKQTD